MEMPALLKGNFRRYSLDSYYFAITAADILFQVRKAFVKKSIKILNFFHFQTICCVFYVSIVYYLTSQPPEWSRYFMFLAICLLTSFVAQSVGVVIGAALHVQSGVFLALIISKIILLFSGFLVTFNAIPIYLRWITYLSFGRYGFEGTALATYSFHRLGLNCHETNCQLRFPKDVLKVLDMDDASYAFDVIALVIMFIVFRVFGYVSLLLRIRSSRSRL